MIPEGTIISSLISKIINDCIDVSKEAIKRADNSRKSKNQDFQIRIYQVIIDAISRFTFDRYKNQDAIYDIAENLLREFKSNAGKKTLEIVKEGLNFPFLNVDYDKCYNFTDFLYQEISKEENYDIYKQIRLIQHDLLMNKLDCQSDANEGSMDEIEVSKIELQQINNSESIIVNDFIEKTVFISYCHKDVNEAWIEELVRKLSEQNIDSIVDIYDLQLGQDVNYFMEKIKAADRVLMLLGKEYKKRADNRIGGVGKETQIISSDMYNDVEQTKCIPIVINKDELGNPYLPIYLDSRLYADFSDDHSMSKNLDGVIRQIKGLPKKCKTYISSPVLREEGAFKKKH